MCVLTNSIFFLFKSKVGHKVVGLKVKAHWMHVYLLIKKEKNMHLFPYLIHVSSPFSLQ